MIEAERSRHSGLSLATLGLMLVAVGVGLGFWVLPKILERPSEVQVTGATKVAFEKHIRNYILEHPEILPEAIEKLQDNGAARHLRASRTELEKPFPDAVLGNPLGSVTLVQFTDYACGYCRQSVADVDALIAANPDLKVVVRELPVLGQASVEAARIALAAARQGKYPAFHRAMFASGPPTPASIVKAAAEAGVDLKRAQADASDDTVASELKRNGEFARELKFSGTPSWIVGDQLFSGAVGLDRLGEAVVRARQPG
jgi:protein-disulfide isomerase